ncbi:MAG TPA: hypothetical protein PKH77_01380 [Anaerolineae bacterium]|nr:hypothetical protein [Anaerolineae bacterium]
MSKGEVWRRAGAIFLLALLVRLIPLGLYVTPDEPIWVMRSVQLADALAAGDWGAIPQTGHPGLTTMALGALGVRLTQLVAPAESAAHLAWIRNLAWLAPENDAAFDHLAFFLPAGRTLVALVTALGVALAYRLASRRLGERAARRLALFLALDPFLIGLSGLLHTDALQATAILLAVLCLLPRRDSALTVPPVLSVALCCAALCLALAGLTKTLGLLAAPGVALALLVRGDGPWVRRLLRVVALAALTLLLFLALYPPFWSDPAAALTGLIGAVGYHEGIGARDVFFLGQLHPDPGPFFYPLVLLLRLTPPVLLGLGLAVLNQLRNPDSRTGAGLWFILPALSYLLPLILATKKFDRYALTAIPLLTALAAQAGAGHREYRGHRGHYVQSRKPLLPTSYFLLLLLLFPWAMLAPLPLFYADPLLGGPWLARRLIPLGWGESAGLAARVAPEATTLLAVNVPGAAPFFAGRTVRWDADLVPCSDLFVQAESPLPAEATPIARLRIAGLPLATLYARAADALRARWDSALPWLLPGPLPGAPADAIAPTGDNVALRDWLAQRIPAGTTFRWGHAPQCHPQAEQHLAALLAAADLTCTPDAPVDAFAVERCTLHAPWHAPPEYQARFDGKLDLLAAVWQETVSAPGVLTVRLRWRALAPLDTLQGYLALWDAAGGVTWLANGNALVDDRTWPAAAWEVGRVTDGTAYLPLPLTLPPGTYTLTLSLSDSAGRQLGVARADGAFGGVQALLGTVTVAAAPYPASALDLPSEVSAPTVGLRLIGATPPPAEHWAGDRLPFSLGWERTPGDPPQQVRWWLRCDEADTSAGALAVAPGDPALWPKGHRYVTHYAPRTDPALAEGICTLLIQAGAEAPAALGDVRVHARARCLPPCAAAPQTPFQVTVEQGAGSFAQLAGFDAPAEALHPGDTFSVTLYWEAQASAALDYTVFVHLVGAEGKVWAQSDAWPQGGVAPTTSWLAEQTIVDMHTLKLPDDAPAGTYTLFVGMYDAGSGGRAPLYDQNGARWEEDRAPLAVMGVR